MGTVLASTIITRARGILSDTDSTSYTWSDADLLAYLNDGQRNIVFMKPDAYIKNESVLLVAGTKQTVPTDGLGLIKITRNMGTDGTTPGKPVAFVLMEEVDYLITDFHTHTACASLDIYTYDKDDPLHYYSYPPQPSSNQGYAELIYPALPADVAASSAITLNDVYQTALLNYILYRAFSREIDPISSSSAGSYYNLYVSELGRKDLAEQEHNASTKG